MTQLTTFRSNQENTECGSKVRVWVGILKNNKHLCGTPLAKTRLWRWNCIMCRWFSSFFPFQVRTSPALWAHRAQTVCGWEVREQESLPDRQTKHTLPRNQRSLSLNDLPGAHPPRTKTPLGYPTDESRGMVCAGVPVWRWGDIILWHHSLSIASSWKVK